MYSRVSTVLIQSNEGSFVDGVDVAYDHGWYVLQTLFYIGVVSLRFELT